LVRGLAALPEDVILAFHQQLMTAVDALDTPDHASQEVFDLDNPLRGLSTAPGDVSLLALVAVVAAGPDVYTSVLADPARLAGGWPLRAAELVLGAAPAAFARVTDHTWVSHPARALSDWAPAVELDRSREPSGTARAPA